MGFQFASTGALTLIIDMQVLGIDASGSGILSRSKNMVEKRTHTKSYHIRN
jgi:hypothetical protein